jgi:hypothetical protein
MKKFILVALVLFCLSGTVMGQDYTFRGLPWGSTKEQVIEKLGKSNSQYNDDRISYFVSVGGYKAMLDIEFDQDSMTQASYNVGIFYRNWDLNQLRENFLVLLGQLENKYGSYHEIITVARSFLVDESHDFFAWHFNNFHVIIAIDNGIGILYFPDSSWIIFEEETMKESDILRLPRTGL